MWRTSPLRYSPVIAGDTAPPRGFAQCGGYLTDRDGLPRADVDRGEPPMAPVGRRGRRVGGGDVVDVDEVAHLAAVLENLWRLALFE